MSKPKTSKFLSAELEQATKANEALQNRIVVIDSERNAVQIKLDKANSEKILLKEQVAQFQAQFNDLKIRLSDAESENQRMRGYISRVQEDDVVREELITTGDPEGERQLNPKRPHIAFNAPNPMSNTGEIDYNYQTFHGEEQRRKPKHWITYGAVK